MRTFFSFSFFFLVTAVVLVAPAHQALAGQQSMAILDIDILGNLDKGMAEPLSDGIRKEIVKSNLFDVMKRPKMNELLNERGYRMRGCAPPECAVTAGKLLNVDKMVVGTVSLVGKTYYLTLWLVDVQTGKTEVVEEGKCKCEADALLESSVPLTDKLLGIVVDEAAASKTAKSSSFVFIDMIASFKDAKLILTKNANPADKSMSWDEANAYIKLMNKKQFGGYNDWRLPTKDELTALVEYAKSQGVKKSLHELFKKNGFKNVQSDYYWTSTTDADVAGLAWILDTYTGEITTNGKTNSNYVWPVRTDPEAAR